MEDRLFSLKAEVVVSDRAGVIGNGIIVGRAFSEPVRYDVAIREGIIKNVTSDQLRET